MSEQLKDGLLLCVWPKSRTKLHTVFSAHTLGLSKLGHYFAGQPKIHLSELLGMSSSSSSSTLKVLPHLLVTSFHNQYIMGHA